MSRKGHFGLQVRSAAYRSVLVHNAWAFIRVMFPLSDLSTSIGLFVCALSMSFGSWRIVTVKGMAGKQDGSVSGPGAESGAKSGAESRCRADRRIGRVCRGL